MTEGIQIEQTRSDGSAAQQGITGGARCGAERRPKRVGRATQRPGWRTEDRSF